MKNYGEHLHFFCLGTKDGDYVKIQISMAYKILNKIKPFST